MQEILNLLQSMGLDTSGGLSGITGGDISGALASQYGITGEAAQHLPPSLFPGITQSQEQQLYGKSYSPLLEAKGTTLTDTLLGAQTGEAARKAYGGFAGTGAKDVYGKKVKTDYLTDMTSALGDIGKQRAQASGNIVDLINAWRTTAGDISAGGAVDY